MARAEPTQPPVVHQLPGESNWSLLRQLLRLTWPIAVEHLLHMLVGLTDTWLANHLPGEQAQATKAATAAVGTISYILWFIGLTVSSIATGSMALIARAKGARHRSLANSICGQSATASLILGLIMAVVLYAAAHPLIRATALQGEAHGFALSYLRMLCISLAFSTFLFVANACLRGAGDTMTPAIAMVVVDVVNIVFSFALTYGWWGFPVLGFHGIAAGTVIAYVVGGCLAFMVLVLGRGGVRLHLHRMRPHWLALKRILRIGVPHGTEGILTWAANFGMIIVINGIDPTNAMPAAHNNAVRIEALSYMGGFAVAMAAAAMVGQSLGMRDPGRATRCAYLAYAVGGGFMTLCGVLFLVASRPLAQWISNDQQIVDMTSQCLFITGFVQTGFAASIVFSSVLRGAGDTFTVMALNLASIFFVRFVGVLFVTLYLHKGLAAVWVVLCVELMVRGAAAYAWFLRGKWKHIRV